MTIFPGDKRIVMYVIRLKNCCFFANHGVFDEEKTLGQRFHVDAEIHVDALPALDTDDVGRRSITGWSLSRSSASCRARAVS